MMKQANRNAKKDEALLKALDGAENQIGITQVGVPNLPSAAQSRLNL